MKSNLKSLRILQTLFSSVFIVLFGVIASAQAAEKVTIAHWGQQKILLYLPLYVAMEEGLFAKKNLEVSLKYSGNDDQVFATVVAGDAQFGIGDPVFAAIARTRGFPGKVVAMLVVRIGISGFTNNGQLPIIESKHDLAGLRIGSFPAPSTTYTLLQNVINTLPKDLPPAKIVQLGIGAQAAGLGAGSIDIATDTEPAVSVAEHKGMRVVFSLDKFTQELAITGLSTTEKFLNEKPEVTKNVVEALEQALQLIHSHPEVGIRVAQKSFPDLAPEVSEKAVLRMTKLGVFPKSTYIDDVYWQRSLELRKASGELKSIENDETRENTFSRAAQKSVAPLEEDS